MSEAAWAIVSHRMRRGHLTFQHKLRSEASRVNKIELTVYVAPFGAGARVSACDSPIQNVKMETIKFLRVVNEEESCQSDGSEWGSLKTRMPSFLPEQLK